MSDLPKDIDRIATDLVRARYEDDWAMYVAIAAALLSERQRSDSLKALCDEMAKALEPFVSAKDLMRCADNENIQDTDAAYSIKHRDIRKARAVIAIYRKEKEVGNG
ncbi:hypothetical protein [Rhizobium sp. RCAM05973]|uniref:hypothetical protein n=1 Tax=Rhizobium sp. RCAM05973 TaxID=2994066 RepID=UPI0022EBC01E|nr:hypothetical protein [Rhizobium sp. RCAM05973]